MAQSERSQTTPQTLPNGGTHQPTTSNKKPEINAALTGTARIGVSNSVAGESRWNCHSTKGTLVIHTERLTAVACQARRVQRRVNLMCQGRVWAISRSRGSA